MTVTPWILQQGDEVVYLGTEPVTTTCAACKRFVRLARFGAAGSALVETVAVMGGGDDEEEVVVFRPHACSGRREGAAALLAHVRGAKPARVGRRRPNG